MASVEQCEKTKGEIAELICSRGWSFGLCRQIQRQYKISQATAYRYRRDILAELAEEERTTPIEEKRAELLELLRTLISQCLINADNRAAANAIRLLAEISGVLHTPPPVVVSVSNRQLSGEALLIELESRIEKSGLIRGPVIDLSEDQYDPA